MINSAYEELINSYFVNDISVTYTLKTDDITVCDKPQGTPYLSRKDEFDDKGYAKKTQSKLSVCAKNGGFYLSLTTESDELSEFGLNLPFKFMGKKNCGGWKKQYLFNSPYASLCSEHIFCYLTNPEGKNLILVCLSEADGWKMDYSLFSGGQYFDNLKILADFDKAYKISNRKTLDVYIGEAGSYLAALKKVSFLKKLPVAHYEKSFVRAGEYIRIDVTGDFDYVVAENEKYNNLGGYALVKGNGYGLITCTPYKSGARGIDCTFYCYDDIEKLRERSMFSVSQKDNALTDGNDCEWKCHVTAILKYMQDYGFNAALYEKIKPDLDVMTERNEEKAKDRQTVYYKARKGFSEYNVFNSDRVQEQFFAAGIFFEAYKTLGEKKYLEYATGAMDCALKRQSADGAIKTTLEWSVKEEDYTTVCCLIIPVIDAAIFLEKIDKARSDRYFECAAKMARHVYERGFDFPTETVPATEAEPFIEEGSMSCSALTLLYYCSRVKFVKEYVVRAKEILDMHENWVVKTPFAPMFHSTLRWWETKWEGDKDGNALCMGHAWTIWRAEADYLYYTLTGDEKYLLKALNGYASNFSKINEEGKSFTCYQPDYITGGGFTTSGKQVTFKIAHDFPKQTDSGLSRYAWARAEDILKEKSGF